MITHLVKCNIHEAISPSNWDILDLGIRISYKGCGIECTRGVKVFILNNANACSFFSIERERMRDLRCNGFSTNQVTDGFKNISCCKIIIYYDIADNDTRGKMVNTFTFKELFVRCFISDDCRKCAANCSGFVIKKCFAGIKIIQK